MFDLPGPGDCFNQDDAFGVLQELEQNTPDEIRRQRTHFRMAVKAKVVLQPGNASDQFKLKIQAVTGDLSEGGCRILSPVPPRVGDIYRLEFDQKTLPVPITFARCVRCSLLREDAFEAGFAFFSAIAMPESAHSGAQTKSSI